MWPWAWRSEVRSLHNSMCSVIASKRHCNDHYGIHVTKPTTQSRILPARLTGPQLVKNFPAFYVTRRFIAAFTWDHRPFLSWARPIQTHASTSLFLKVSFNIILPSTPGSLRWSPLPQVFQPNPCTHLSYIPYVPHAPPFSFDLIARVIPDTYKCHSFIYSDSMVRTRSQSLNVAFFGGYECHGIHALSDWVQSNSPAGIRIWHLCCRERG